MFIGLSLISVGINSFGGDNSAKDFGSMEKVYGIFLYLIQTQCWKYPVLPAKGRPIPAGGDFRHGGGEV